MSYKIAYTADDEEPDCMKCYHVCGWVYKDYKGKFHDGCAEHCGAEREWNGYRRTEEVSE